MHGRHQAVAPIKAWIAPGAVSSLLASYNQATSAEPCGVLIGAVAGNAVRIRGVAVLPNAHVTPDRGFLITAEDLLQASKTVEESGAAIIGFWHGHLRGGPYPGRQDADEFTSFAAGPNGSWAQALLLAGRGETGRPVLRVFVTSRDGLREVPLRT
jgi:proteasome lid subunit RPN8/RPN11